MNNPAFQQTVPVQCRHTGRWSSTFEAYGTYSGRRVLISSCTSGAVWATEQAAAEGAARALHTLEQTGRFPNMCAQW